MNELKRRLLALNLALLLFCGWAPPAAAYNAPEPSVQAADTLTVYGNGGTYFGSTMYVHTIENYDATPSYLLGYTGTLFTRNGYYPVSYNTKADGSGTTYTLDACFGGSYLRMVQSEGGKLYV